MPEVPVHPRRDWNPAENLTRDSIGQIVTITVDELTEFKGRLDAYVISTGDGEVIRDWGRAHVRNAIVSCTVEVILSGIGPITIPGASRVSPRFDQ